MNEEKPVNNNSDKSKREENPLKVQCPFCGEYTTIILDPKQVSDEKTSHLCLICGQTFEYIKRYE